MDHNFGGPAKPSATRRWYRSVGGKPWEALSTIKYIGNDENEINQLITSVESGIFHPDPIHNPYRKVLSSKRTLTFQWTVNPSSHTIDVRNIQLRGKANTSLLMKF